MEETINTVIGIIHTAKKNGVDIVLNGDKLQLKVAKDSIVDQALMDQIKANKSAIVEFLSNNTWRSMQVNGSSKKIYPFNRQIVQAVPLSFAQQRLHFISQLETSPQYHSVISFRLNGQLNKQALFSAISLIIQRHQILRTVYKDVDGETCQVVIEAEHWKPDEIEISGTQTLEQIKASFISKPFNLTSDYMLRAGLVAINDDEHVLVVVMHHIASDAWSMPVIAREVMEGYTSFNENRPVNLPELPLQYADYAVWQRNYLKGDILSKKIQYWKDALQGAQPLNLPTDRPRPPVRTGNGAATFIRVDKTTSALLNELSQQHGASLYMVLLAAFNVLMYRYSNQHDISVGASIANRSQKEVEGLIGFFVNTITFRSQVNPAETFTQLLNQVKETSLGAYEHQDVPFEKVVEAVLRDRDASRTPLFQVMLVLINTPASPKAQLGDLTLTGEPIQSTQSKFDLTFFVNESSEGLRIAAEYSTDLFEKDTIDRMLTHYSNLLQAIVSAPQQQVGLLPLITPSEEKTIKELGKNTTDYDRNKNIVTLFEEQVTQHSEKTALVFADKEISYAQLNEEANQLSHFLRSKGIGKNSLVPLFIDNGKELMTALLGILKSGAAYVPIDTSYPAERIGFILKDVNATIAVTSNSNRARLADAAIGNLELITCEDSEVGLQPKNNLVQPAGSCHAAYVIYTSGSTGRPKGVLISHKSIHDYVAGLRQKIDIEQCRSFASVSTIATDLGNTSIYSSLLTGATLHLFSKAHVSSIEYLHNYFSQHQVDCLKIVPGHWKVLNNEGRLLLPQKLLIFGGEALAKATLSLLLQESVACTIVNHYGPTETTIGKLLHVADAGKLARYGNTIPIGQPFGNTQIYVLSSQLQLNPVGIPGQLFIGGHGLAIGYHNNSTLTREKFIDNPFLGSIALEENGQSAKLYATGDLVRMLPGGDIEFLGRVDDQVKIRGYRVELGEIESTIKHFKGVSQAAVLAVEDKQGNNRLQAYVAGDHDLNADPLSEWLRQQLPDYMVPQSIITLELLPLTANGKVDKKALIGLNGQDVQPKGYVPPQTATQRTLAAIWQQVLEVDEVGIHNDFFELGGHSLLAVRLVSAIRKQFKVEIPISHLFDFPTVALLSNELESQSANDILPPVVAVHPRPQRIPLSYSQERLWFIDKFEGSVSYHIPVILNISGNLDINALESALTSLVNRHEILRTIILEFEGAPYQSVKGKGEWKLKITNGTRYRHNREALSNYISKVVREPFKLSEDDMLRAELITLGESEYTLIFVLHHIASDGWSRPILINEITDLYKKHRDQPSFVVPDLDIQYADYAIWQRNYLSGEVLEKKLDFWKQKLDGVEPLELPTDLPRSAIPAKKGAHHSFFVDKATLDQLNKIGHKNGATIFMTMLTCFKVLLHRYTSQTDICIGTPVAGRQHAEVENLIGFFVNTLVLRTEVDGQSTFEGLLRQVKEGTLQAYTNQDVPFEKIVEAVVKERDLNRTPLFQVMFVLQNMSASNELNLGDLKLSSEKAEYSSSKFDLTFSLTERSDGISAGIDYSASLFYADTIARMANNFLQLLQSIIKYPDQKISELNILKENERHQLLVKFNETTAEYPREKNIVSLFEEQVVKSPGAIALVYNNDRITYRQLDTWVNQLANYLQSKGVEQRALVPICMEKSVGMMVGILGILKAGAAYVPIDPDYPADRIQNMLTDIGAKILLVSNDTAAFAGAFDLEVLNLSEGAVLTQDQPVGKPAITIMPDSLAYVIYTSGSTGKPKGVMVEHRSVVNLVSSNNFISLSPADVLISTGSPSFDATIFEYWSMLLHGGQLVLCDNDTLLDIEQLKKSIGDTKATIMWFTSSWFNQLVETDISVFEKLQTIIVGGEKLSENHIAFFRNVYPHINVINGYGPTENTTFSLTYKVNNWKNGTGLSIPIGRPLQNRRAYILDKHGSPVPIGVYGEICLSGDGIARGYLKNEEFTKQKFVDNPFEKEGSKLYKTGDHGRFLADGNIEYWGRLDDQVKLRGYRIELAEIENAIAKTGLIKKAVVLCQVDELGGKNLVGYIIQKGEFDQQVLVSQLGTVLPAYMIPAHWVVMESFPLTRNGKLDKKSFPLPEIGQLASKTRVPPRSDLELKLVEIWRDLLRSKQIGIFDDFFEAGGHSLLAIRLLYVLNKELKVKLSVKELFLNSTIDKLSSLITEKLNDVFPDKEKFRCLVPLKPEGSKVPLYIVSGGGGTVFRFREFAKLMAEDQPIYGLQQTDLKEDFNDIPRTIEKIAERYVNEILMQNPNGPYYLSGYCVGGIIAFEMAKQLSFKGKEVGFLAMFDTLVFRGSKNVPLSGLNRIKAGYKQLKKRLALKVEFESYLFTKHPRVALQYKINNLKNLFAQVVQEKTIELEYAKTEIYERLALLASQSVKQYHFTPYKGEIIAFYAKEHFYFEDKINRIRFKPIVINENSKNFWKQYSSKTTIYEIEGVHSMIFDPQNAKEFARILQQHLDKQNEIYKLKTKTGGSHTS